MGHVGRLYQVAKALERRAKVDITFYVAEHSSAPDIVIGDQFRVIKIPVPKARKGHAFIEFGDSVEKRLQDGNFDAVINDGCPFRWMSTLRLPDCLHVFITNAFLTGHFTQDTVQSRWFEKPVFSKIQHIRNQKGLSPIKALTDLYNADLVLLSDPPELFPDLKKHLPRHFAFTGPIVWSASAGIPKSLRGKERFSLISMGSTGKRIIDDKFLSIIRQFTGSNRLIYAGHQADNLRRLKHIDQAFKFLPLNRIMDQVEAVVTQGGSGSSYQALSHGAPLLIFPTHINQEILGRVFERAGLGVCLGLEDNLNRFDEFDFDQLTQNADRFASKFLTQPGAGKAANIILRHF